MRLPRAQALRDASAAALRAQRMARRLLAALLEDTDAEVAAAVTTARRKVRSATLALVPPSPPEAEKRSA